MLISRVIILIILASVIYECCALFRLKNKHKNFENNSMSATIESLENIFENKLKPVDLPHFLNGAHIVFKDNGVLFKHLQDKVGSENLRRRTSFHYNIFTRQYAFSMLEAGIPEILFGIATIDGKKVSWIQAERYSCKGIIQSYWHTIDALIYLCCAKKFNIGPLGISKFTSSNPLFLNSV